MLMNVPWSYQRGIAIGSFIMRAPILRRLTGNKYGYERLHASLRKLVQVSRARPCLYCNYLVQIPGQYNDDFSTQRSLFSVSVKHDLIKTAMYCYFAYFQF